MKRFLPLLATVAIVALLLPFAPAQSNGGFGTQVKSGDSDATRTVRDAGSPSICRIDYGTTDSFLDDMFYAVWDGGTTIDPGSLRLAVPASSEKVPGTVVAAQDTGEVGVSALSTDHCDTTPTFCFGGTGTYGLDRAASVSAGVTSADPVSTPDSSTTPDAWTVLLMPYGEDAPGRLVTGPSGASKGFGTSDSNTEITGAEFTYHDADTSASPGAADFFYMAASAVSTGSTIPVASVRLTAGQAVETTTSTTPSSTTSPTTTTTSATTTSSPTTVETSPPTTRPDGEGNSNVFLWVVLGGGALVAALVVGTMLIVRARTRSKRPR